MEKDIIIKCIVYKETDWELGS